MIQNIYLIFILMFIKIDRIFLQQMDAYCQNQDNNGLICSNFDAFTQLNLSYFKPENENGYKSLIFKPAKLILLDDSLVLLNLKIENTYEIEFDLLYGLNVISNPLALLDMSTKATLTLKNSVFDLFYEGKIIDIDTCNYIIQNELIVSILYTCNKFILDSPTFSNIPICPVIFEGANLELFEVQNISTTNVFSIIDSAALNLTDLPFEYNINITMFRISSSDLVLNEAVLSPFVFSKLNKLSIVNSFLRNIQNDLFVYFGSFKIFEVELYNFKEFIRTIQNNDSWISSLNSNISVNLANETDFVNNKDDKILLLLTDLNQTYVFPDEDFCIFKNFPHSKLVVPKISTKPDLDCSCTLLWLIQYKSLYQEDLDTPSVVKCLNDPSFDQLVNSCNFELRIKSCNGKFIIIILKLKMRYFD